MGFYSVLAAAVAFAVTFLLGKWMYPILRRRALPYPQEETEPMPNQKSEPKTEKQSLPTMGGILIILGVICAAFIALPLCFSAEHQISYLQKTRAFGGLLMALGFALIGFFDDVIAISNTKLLSLRWGERLILQAVVSCAYLISLYMAGERGNILVPWCGYIDLGVWYWPISLTLLLCAANAFRKTGEGGYMCLTSSAFLMALTLLLIGVLCECYGMATLSAATAGGCLGFLFWNFSSTKLLLGGLGSGFFAGMVCAVVFGLGMPELVLPLSVLCWLKSGRPLPEKKNHNTHNIQDSAVTLIGCAAALLAVLLGI